MVDANKGYKWLKLVDRTEEPPEYLFYDYEFLRGLIRDINSGNITRNGLETINELINREDFNFYTDKQLKQKIVRDIFNVVRQDPYLIELPVNTLREIITHEPKAINSYPFERPLISPKEQQQRIMRILATRIGDVVNHRPERKETEDERLFRILAQQEQEQRNLGLDWRIGGRGGRGGMRGRGRGGMGGRGGRGGGSLGGGFLDFSPRRKSPSVKKSPCRLKKSKNCKKSPRCTWSKRYFRKGKLVVGTCRKRSSPRTKTSN